MYIYTCIIYIERERKRDAYTHMCVGYGQSSKVQSALIFVLARSVDEDGKRGRIASSAVLFARKDLS